MKTIIDEARSQTQSRITGVRQELSMAIWTGIERVR
jgi:hypothetical protein